MKHTQTHTDAQRCGVGTKESKEGNLLAYILIFSSTLWIFSGRLPFTVPLPDQLPDELDMNMNTAPGRTYRYLTETPLYAFGYGLSYTSFSYSSMTLSGAQMPPTEDQKFTVCANVTNTGSIPGDEVVQVYVQLNVTNRFEGLEMESDLRVCFERGGRSQ